MTAGMRALPDPSGVAHVPGQRHRPATDGAADVVATVGADKEDRCAGAELRQRGRHRLAVTHGQGREQPQQVLRVSTAADEEEGCALQAR